MGKGHAEVHGGLTVEFVAEARGISWDQTAALAIEIARDEQEGEVRNILALTGDGMGACR